MCKQFYIWLARKYGWSRAHFERLEEDFKSALAREFRAV